MEYATAGLLIAFVVVVVVLGPLFGADSRDGRDWQSTGPRPERKRRGMAERARRQVALWDAYLTANQPWREQGPLRWRRIGDEWLLEGDTPPALPDEASRGGDTGSVAGSAIGSADGTADVDDIDGDLDGGRGLRVGPPHDGS
ncbi:hypothetical protein OG216_04890 [Streptomycetaceae bacterium NBC_01309]